VGLLDRMKRAQEDKLAERHERQEGQATQRAQKLGLDTADALGVWATLGCSAGTEDVGIGVVVVYPNRVEVAGKPPMKSVSTRTVLARNIASVDVSGGSVFSTVTIAGSGDSIVCKIDKTQASAFRSAVMSVIN
jgi:hypothetical protein